MLTVDEAIDAILARCRALPARSTPLIDALGLVLAEDIAADIDLPPFDKALMDGYAVRSVDLADSGGRRFRITEEITAGRVPQHPILEGEAARIMTGAPLPSGADAVVMVERSRMAGEDVILDGPVRPGLNRLVRGREMKAGEILLPRGTTLDAPKLGLIASAGHPEVLAIPGPVVCVVPTGDELVPISEIPQHGQIRNSNGVMLTALARTPFRRAFVCEEPIAKDDPEALRKTLGRYVFAADGPRRPPETIPSILDLLIISGGVSAGTKDLVPTTLVDLGIEPVFHKVNVKPGKPLWFGVGPRRGYKERILVFGLPGNPVSGVVCFLLFVRPALEALAGRVPKRTQLASFRLGAPYEHRGDRPTYHPARLVDDRVFPLDWAGSADLRTVALADGFAAFPAGDAAFQAGDPVSFLPLR
jgi:molybdopterin molybdotransferase